MTRFRIMVEALIESVMLSGLLGRIDQRRMIRKVECWTFGGWLLTGLLIGGVLGGCGASPETSSAPRAASTKQMAQRLKRIADRAESNPRQNMYVNTARARQLSRMRLPRDLRARLQYKVTLGQEWLRAGDNKKAIQQFQEVLDFAEERGAPESYVLAIKDYLAISYMRLGEMQNCVTDHNAQRCLFPIRGEGVHTQKRGSRKAITQYTDILKADPDDLNARWLLNVAYMTLGTYPDSVPEPWRIPPQALESDYDITRFRDVAIPLGLDVMGLSGGVVMEDLNNDGHLDIMASSWGVRDQVRYFENTGDGGFVERTMEAGLKGIVGGLNMVHADYNNDGYEDVLILRGAWLPRGHPNSLLRNDGDGTFTDVTKQAGLLTAHPTQTAAWGDYNNDGYLDLFIGNESATEGSDIPWIPENAGEHPCALYRNNGDGTFTNVAAEVGLDVTSYVKGTAWGDYNNDGRIDLYLSSLSSPNRLFRNEGDEGDGWRFAEVGEAAGVREPIESFPTWFWDYNNDGWLDIFVAGWKASAGDIAAEYLGQSFEAAMPRLYRNNGDGTFTNVATEAQVDKVMYAMGANYGDLDNDGWLDFYVGTGDPDYRSLIPSRMFRNAEGREFQEVTESGGFGHLQKGHGIAFGDLDHDGDQDIYAVMGGAFEGDVFHNVLFENPGHGNHWITLRLEGTTSNRSAIGARIKAIVETKGGSVRAIHRTVSTGGSFGASSLQQEIGLGAAQAVRAIEVTWPATGTTQRFEGVGRDQIVQIREGDSGIQAVSQKRFTLTGRGGQ